MQAMSVVEFYSVAVHIGKVVEAKVAASGIPITRVAKALRTSRTTLYAWFENASWDTEALLLCSKLLKEDLFQVYSKELRSMMPTGNVASEPSEEYQRTPPSAVEITIKSSGASGEMIERIMKAVEGPAPTPVVRSTVTRKPRRSR